MKQPDPLFKVGDLISFHHMPHYPYKVVNVKWDNGAYMLEIGELGGWFNESVFQIWKP